jgi:hypothetical protein
VALPRPAPARRVFRPARRVSWGTRIFAFFVLLIALGAIGGFLEVFLPQQLASVARLEGNELQTARQGGSDVSTSVNALWTDLAKGTVGLSSDQLAKDLTLSKETEKAANAALLHVQAAQAYLAQADGMPFQFHTPSFVVTDRPALNHLQTALNAATKLTHGASVQIAFAQNMGQNSQTLAALNATMAAGNWADGARIASSLASAIKLQQGVPNDPETLLDPLWGHWVDAMLTVVLDAQQLCLASAQNQSQLAAQDAHNLQVARAQLAASFADAEANVPAWQAKTIKPLLDTVAKEISAAGS